MRTFLLGALAASILSAGPGWVGAADDAKDKAVEKELKLLQGTWVPVSTTVNGKEMPKQFLKNLQVEIKGNKVTKSAGDRSVKGTITLGPGKNPKTMDTTLVAPNGKKIKVLAIYSIKGNKLTVYGVGPGKKRPKKFASEKDSGQELTVYKRKKSD
jgi:uncharacterized protein (TIGR03067 family)